MNNIIFKKIWEDELCFLLRVDTISDYASISSNIYASETTIKKIQQKILNFVCNNKERSCKVNLGALGEDYTPAIELLLTKDRCGHVLIDTIFQLDDGAVPKHQCCFFIKTELGLLEKFAKKITGLHDAPLQTAIMLWEE